MVELFIIAPMVAGRGETRSGGRALLRVSRSAVTLRRLGGTLGLVHGGVRAFEKRFDRVARLPCSRPDGGPPRDFPAAVSQANGVVAEYPARDPFHLRSGILQPSIQPPDELVAAQPPHHIGGPEAGLQLGAE